MFDARYKAAFDVLRVGRPDIRLLVLLLAEIDRIKPATVAGLMESTCTCTMFGCLPLKVVKRL